MPIKLFLLLFITICLFAQEDKVNIAVMELEGNGIPKTELGGLSNRLRSELFTTGKYTVVERSRMDEILKEQGFQKTGCNNTECAVEIGRLVNVNKIIIGSVDKVGTIYSADIRIVNVETGEIEKNAAENCEDCSINDVLKTTIHNVARLLSGLEADRKIDKKSMPMGKASLYINALGLFQFGPIIGTEIGVGPNIFIDLHWRYAAAGLIYAAILTEGFQDFMSMGSMAVGIGARHFFSSNRPHRFYIGGFVEYGWGKTWGEDDYDDVEWRGSEAQIIPVFNAGYRFRFNSAFFINLGVLAGSAIDLKDEWYYVDDSSTKYDQKGAVFFGMLEFSLGWEFGK